MCLRILSYSLDFSAAKLTRRTLPTLVAHASAIDTVSVDATVRVAGRIRRQRRWGGGGSRSYVHHPTNQRRPQYWPRHRNYTALISYHLTALPDFCHFDRLPCQRQWPTATHRTKYIWTPSRSRFDATRCALPNLRVRSPPRGSHGVATMNYNTNQTFI